MKGTLGAFLLGHLLSGKRTVRAGEGIVRAGYCSSIKKKALIPPHPLTLFLIFIKKMSLNSITFVLEIICLKQKRTEHM